MRKKELINRQNEVNKQNQLDKQKKISLILNNKSKSNSNYYINSELKHYPSSVRD